MHGTLGNQKGNETDFGPLVSFQKQQVRCLIDFHHKSSNLKLKWRDSHHSCRI